MPKKPITPSILPSSYTLTSTTTLCSLWSNYGSISRLSVTSNDNENETPQQTSLILKTILPPSSSPTASESHLRKLISYRVERYFYSHLSPLLSSPQTPTAKVASLIAIDDSTGQLLLEDLSIDYPVTCYGSTGQPQTAAVLSWLAGFHGTFWGITTPHYNASAGSNQSSNLAGDLIPPPLQASQPDSTSGIWSRGGYWYLSTRSEEHASLLDGGDQGEYGWLIPWAEYADQKIEKEKEEWKTAVHGDAKGANIMFSRPVGVEGVKAALYDFQYCGIATPAVDLVYFIGTTVDRKLLRDLKGLLKIYYEELCRVYENIPGGSGKGLEEETGYSFEALEEQWDVAIVDWMRFMAGWGVWGNWRWVEGQAKEIVRKWEKEERNKI
ncbi:hypothetical protein ABW19_dt0210464 [Dactylella cylindrospora]|nr:hypothetical protein ABW19_dt0210464 [Dactylella cylindrospora]